MLSMLGNKKNKIINEDNLGVHKNLADFVNNNEKTLTESTHNEQKTLRDNTNDSTKS